MYRAWKAAEGYPKYLEHVCGKDGSVKLVKKTSVCVEIRTEDRPTKKNASRAAIPLDH